MKLLKQQQRTSRRQLKQQKQQQQQQQQHSRTSSARRSAYSPIIALSSLVMLLSSRSRIAAFAPTRNARFSTRAFAILSDGDTLQRQQQSPSADALYLPGRPDFAIQKVAAPMVAASNYPFRCLCRQYGVDLTFTQMLNARNLLTDHTFVKNHLDFHEYDGPDHTAEFSRAQAALLVGGDGRASTLSEEDRERFGKGPLVVQMAGHNVDMVVRAAQFLYERTEGKIDGVDLNLGCPQGIARKGNYGAFLMEQDEATVCRILAAVRQALPKEVSVSAKVRLPVSDELLVERIPRLLDTGINFLTVHGRTLHENKTKVQACHVDRIRLATETARKHAPDFPVIANGGIEHFGDVGNVRQKTGAVAIMSSEGLLERPNIFAVDSSEYSPRQVLEQQFQFARDYLSWCRVSPPLPGVLGNTHGSFNMVKGHVFKFLHRYLQDHSDMRDRLTKLHTLAQADGLIDELYDRYRGKSEEEMSGASLDSTSWYRRHQSANARVHQREVQLSSDFLATKAPVSMQERKALAKERIATLKAQRLEKQMSV